MEALKTRQQAGTLQSLVSNCLTSAYALTTEEAMAVRTGMGPTETAPAGAELVADPTLSRPPRILLQGWAAEQRVLNDGRRQIFRFLLPGDVFGTRPKPPATTADVTAITSVLATPLHSAGMAEEGGLAPVFARISDIVAAESLQGLRNQVVRLGRLSAYERMAHLMLEIYFRLDRVGLTDGACFEMPLPQDVLADALGLSTVHTNRVLQKLRGDGLLETRRNLCCLPELAKLMQIADYGGPRRPL